MNLQIVSTKLSSANQTAVPSMVRKLMDLQPGDKLLWFIDQKEKAVKVKQAPRKWGVYMRGLGKEIWQKLDAQEYIAKLRGDRE